MDNPTLVVSSPLAPLPVAPAPVLTPKNPILPIFIIILFLFLVAVISVLAYQNWRLQQQITALQAQPAPTPTPTITPAFTTASNTSKIISSTKYRYSIEIPSDWTKLAGPPEDESLFNFRKGDYEISLGIIPTTAKTIQSYLQLADQESLTAWEGQPSVKIISTKLTKINDYSVVRREEEWLAAAFQKPVINTYFLSQGNIYSLTLKYLGSTTNPAVTENTTYNQVLSTFKFLDNTTNWKTYTDSKNGFSIRYPSTWRSASLGENGIGFGPKEIGEDVLWGINVYDKSVYPKEKIIDEAGKQFSDRKQNTNNIDINGIQAIRLITTTSSIPDWYLETIIIEYGSNFVTISNGAINDTKLQTLLGVPKGTTFKDFYSTFKFTR